MPRKYVQGKGYGIILLLSSLCFIFPKFSFDTWTSKSKFSGHRFWLSTQRLTLTKGKKIQLFSFVLTNYKMHHSFWRIVPNDRQKEIHFKRNFFHLILKNHQIWQKFLKNKVSSFHEKPLSGVENANGGHLHLGVWASKCLSNTNKFAKLLKCHLKSKNQTFSTLGHHQGTHYNVCSEYIDWHLWYTSWLQEISSTLHPDMWVIPNEHTPHLCPTNSIQNCVNEDSR